MATVVAAVAVAEVKAVSSATPVVETVAAVVVAEAVSEQPAEEGRAAAVRSVYSLPQERQPRLSAM
jgi:hypothetical protein